MRALRVIKNASHYVLGLIGLGGFAISLSDCTPPRDYDGECTGDDEECDGENPVCGDDIVDSDEECDDGNRTSGDGCSSRCQNEGDPAACGDGSTGADEECDDGNNDDDDGCSTLCTVEAPPNCGDNTVDEDEGEECDDGNTTSDDGCSATCMIEDPTVDDEICDDDEDNDGDSDVDCDDDDCASDEACAVDPCESVTCDAPPDASCTDDVLTSYAEAGTCDGGDCSYEPTMTDCTDTGRTCAAGACVGKIIYLTGSPTNATFGGVSAADILCNASPPNGSDYKALLVDGTNRVACTSANCATDGVTEHTDWVLAPNTGYTREDGTLIGTTNEDGVFLFPLDASIAGSGLAYWTGLSADWTTSVDTCDGWTETSGFFAEQGLGDFTTSDAIRGVNLSCAALGGAFIACVEQ